MSKNDDEFHTTLSPAAWDKFVDALNNPKPPTPELIALMKLAKRPIDPPPPASDTA
jgi:uncharacterized protein (DUF1778 family)